MYLRRATRKNKDGSTATYIQLAHNVWDSDKGYSKTQVLYNFGREDELDLDALRRLIHSISRFLGPEEALAAQSAIDHPELRFVTSKPLGGAWALDQLWREVQIDQVVERLAERRALRTPVERAIFAMVASQALSPQSKLSIEEWLADDVALPGVSSSIPVHQLYRAMDFLLEVNQELQYEVFFHTAHLLNLEVDLLYFDTTLVHFELDEEDRPDAEPKEPPRRNERPKSLRTFGRSSAKHPDLPQVLIGLAVTREGIPVRCWVWPGKTTDPSVVEEVKKDLVGWRLGRVITVIDRGFTSEENLRELQRAGGHYIAGERMRSGKEDVEAALATRGRYHTIRENLDVKEIVIGDGEARRRYVLVRNPAQAERDKAKRQEILARLEAELSGLKNVSGGEHTRRVCALISDPVYGRYLRQTKKGVPKIDRAKVKAEERLDGKYLLRTSDDTLSKEDVALGYKQLAEIESAFRTLKHTIDLRPVYHRVDDRIRAHVLLCWLALLLVRIAELRCKATWPNLRRTLQRIHLGEFSGRNGTVLQRSELTSEQRQILAAMGVSEPPRFFDIETQSAETA